MRNVHRDKSLMAKIPLSYKDEPSQGKVDCITFDVWRFQWLPFQPKTQPIGFSLKWTERKWHKTIDLQSVAELVSLRFFISSMLLYFSVTTKNKGTKDGEITHQRITGKSGYIFRMILELKGLYLALNTHKCLLLHLDQLIIHHSSMAIQSLGLQYVDYIWK